MELLRKKSLTEFADALGAKESVPGGGGAAAYVGALSAALCAMAGNFTVGKKKFAPYEEDLQRMLSDLEALRDKLVKLVDQDAAAFAPLSKAYALPKNAPGRDEILEEATYGALVPPLLMMQTMAEVLNILIEMEGKCTRLLISDIGCSAILLRAAMESAALNVYINTKALKDRDRAAAIDGEVDQLLSTCVPKTEEIATRVRAAIRS